MFQVVRTLELDVDVDVVDKAGSEHLLFLSVGERIRTAEQSEEVALVLRYCTRMAKKA
jgi:hypothetical protein